jgi:hypothetical protein
MVVTRSKYITVMLTFLLIASMFLSACKGNSTTSGNESTGGSTVALEDSPTADAAETPQTATSPSSEPIISKLPEENVTEWLGISADGVDEDAFLNSLDIGLLEEIASEFYALAKDIQQKEINDPEYVLRGEWSRDTVSSDRYIKVINMGESAMKPLYWIIYKSSSQGFYEYVCCLALQELSGFDFSDAVTQSQGWATSKEFLDLFTQRILEETQ